MTHICVNKITIIVWEIIWINASILLIGSLKTNFSEILIKMYTFSFKEMYLHMSHGKWRPSCIGPNVLNLKAICLALTCNLFWVLLKYTELYRDPIYLCNLIQNSRNHLCLSTLNKQPNCLNSLQVYFTDTDWDRITRSPQWQLRKWMKIVITVKPTSNISRNLVGNGVVDHSVVVAALPVVAAPTTSPFST